MYCEKRVVLFCGGEEGEKEAAGGRGIMEMEIVNVLVGVDGWGLQKERRRVVIQIMEVEFVMILRFLF